MEGALRRPVWWREVLLVVSVYGAYTLTRNNLADNVAVARRHAVDLYEVEQRVHMDVEHAINAFVAATGAHTLAILANYLYSLLHFLVTLSVLVWLYARRPDRYRAGRTILLLTTVVGLVGFWLWPLAPPRDFPALGFVDTVVRDGTWGSWGSGAVTRMSNQYAAMPSIHVAWSVWVAVVVVMCARRRLVRILAVGYPVLVALVVLGTANHWTFDIIGGCVAVAVGSAGWWLGRLLITRYQRLVVAEADMKAKQWHVDVFLTEKGDLTEARAVLVGDSPAHVTGSGTARRNPHDRSIPEIGDELATARALSQLADHLVDVTYADISAAEDDRAFRLD